MDHGRVDLIEQIERCRRLARSVTDEDMRSALEDLADEYEMQLKQRGGKSFMLRNGG